MSYGVFSRVHELFFPQQGAGNFRLKRLFVSICYYLSFFETVICSFLCVLRLIGLIGMIESSHHHIITSALFALHSIYRKDHYIHISLFHS